LPIFKNKSGKPLKAEPFVKTIPIPVNKFIVPSVASMGAIPAFATSSAFTAPHKTPMHSPAKHAKATTKSEGSLTEESPICMIMAATIPESTAVPVIERSIPPLISTRAEAMDRNPSSGSWTAIERKFAALKNTDGLKMLKAAATTIKMAKSLTRWRSRFNVLSKKIPS